MRFLPLAVMFFCVSVPQHVLADPLGEVEKLMADYRLAWESGNPAGLATLYTPDAELADPNTIVRGTKAIEQLYAQSFASGLAASTLVTKVESVSAVARDVRYGRGVSRISLAVTPGATSSQSFCGRFFAVLKRTPKGWRIAGFNEVPLKCEKAFG